MSLRVSRALFAVACGLRQGRREIPGVRHHRRRRSGARFALTDHDRQAAHARRLPRQGRRGVLRLHAMPRRMSDDARDARRRDEAARAGCRPGAGAVRHRRSRARHRRATVASTCRHSIPASSACAATPTPRRARPRNSRSSTRSSRARPPAAIRWIIRQACTSSIRRGRSACTSATARVPTSSRTICGTAQHRLTLALQRDGIRRGRATAATRARSSTAVEEGADGVRVLPLTP